MGTGTSIPKALIALGRVPASEASEMKVGVKYEREQPNYSGEGGRLQRKRTKLIRSAAGTKGSRKRKPDGTLSKSKVGLINRVLGDLLQHFRDEAGGKSLTLLDDEQLPQYDDAVLVISQLSSVLKQFNEEHFRMRYERPHRALFSFKVARKEGHKHGKRRLFTLLSIC